MQEADLLKLKKRIDEAQAKISEATGQEKALLRQLKSEYKCDNEEQAVAKIEELDSEIEIIDKRMDKIEEEIEEIMKSWK